MNPMVCDAILVLVLLIAVFRGYHKGFVLTLCGFLALFVALIGASVVSSVLAQPVADAIFPIVEQGVYQVLVDYQLSAAPAALLDSHLSAGDITISMDEILTALKASPLFLGIAEAFQRAVETGMVDVSANAARAVAEYAAIQIAQIALFLLSFVAILVAWFLLSHALDLAFHLPVLSTLNRWSGAVLGLGKGALLIFIACWLLKDTYLSPKLISGSYLLPIFCSENPLLYISMLNS